MDDMKHVEHGIVVPLLVIMKKKTTPFHVPTFQLYMIAQKEPCETSFRNACEVVALRHGRSYHLNHGNGSYGVQGESSCILREKVPREDSRNVARRGFCSFLDLPPWDTFVNSG
jgi:hypothetical protein